LAKNQIGLGPGGKRGIIFQDAVVPKSLTNKWSASSRATLAGPHSEAAVIRCRLQKLVVKLPAWPKTRAAVVPLVKGVLYSRTRLLEVSAT